jgi:uncharacterized protein (TIGR03067 family)
MIKINNFGKHLKLFFILVVLCQIISCSSSEETIVKQPGELNGGWLPIKQEIGGKELPPESFEGERFAIVENSFLIISEGADQGTITYSNGKMDIIVEVGVNEGKHFKAIYKLENNQLTICYDLSGSSYPESFNTSGNQNLFLSVFRKEG